MLLGQTDAGDQWDVRWAPFSLDQTKVPEGAVDIWDDPAAAAARMAAEVGIAVRDGWPDAFPVVHRSLFAVRHDEGLDIRARNVVAAVLTAAGLDADKVFDAVRDGGPRNVFRVEHRAVVAGHRVFGVPTVVAGGRAAFIRLVDRPGTDAAEARATVDRCVDLVTGWPVLNELKHTTIPR